MKPLIEIRCLVPTGEYAYSIGAHRTTVCDADSAFQSLERCLHDAGESLGSYFSSVQIRYEGACLSVCATELLRCSPGEVADELLQMGTSLTGHMVA